MRPRRESKPKPEPLQSVGVFTELRFAASGFFDQPVALRDGQGMFLQVLERQGRSRLSNRHSQSPDEPVLQDADTPDAALVKESQEGTRSGGSAKGICSPNVCNIRAKVRRSGAFAAS